MSNISNGIISSNRTCLFQIENWMLDNVQKELSIALKSCGHKRLASDEKNKRTIYLKEQYILTCISVKSDRMERRESSLTSVDLMGTYWTVLPTRPTHFQCNLFNLRCSRSIALYVNDYQMIFPRPVSICHVCVETCLFLSPQFPNNTQRRHQWEKNPSLKFLFYFCFIHLATSK